MIFPDYFFQATDIFICPFIFTPCPFGGHPFLSKVLDLFRSDSLLPSVPPLPIMGREDLEPVFPIYSPLTIKSEHST